jgi:hypothetical protein
MTIWVRADVRCRQRHGQLKRFTRQHVRNRSLKRKRKPQQWSFRCYQTASIRYIEIEEMEEFQKVFSTQSTKDSLKGMADGD